MRLITRGDLDGLACAVIITSREEIEDILLVHPQQITDGEVEIGDQDILANVPYHPNCAKWFDHHLLTTTNREPPESFEGRFGYAPSAAELVWDYYGRDPCFEHLVVETSRFDSARLTREDVLDPQGVILLGFTIDGRSGLGEFRDYFLGCCDWLKTQSIDEVLEQEEVKKRVILLRQRDEEFRRVTAASSRVEKNVVFTDLRSYDELPIGNRFLIYVLYPQCNVSMRVHWGREREYVMVVVAHSIINRTCRTNVGILMSSYGGGGHVGAGSTPLPLEQADEKIAEILTILKDTG